MASSPNSAPQPGHRRVLSHLTDDNDAPLARPLPRRDPLLRLASAWSGTDEAGRSTDSMSGDGDAYAQFVKRMFTGLHTRLPDRTSFVLRERQYATMADASEGREGPPRCAGAVRLRHEHIGQYDEGRPPVMRWGLVNVRSRHSVMSIVYNAVVREMADLERVVQSMEVRKYDIGASDVQALFAWFKVVETLVRLYLTATEVAVYARGRVARWGAGRGVRGVGSNSSSRTGGSGGGRMGSNGNVGGEEGDRIWREGERRAAKVAVVALAEKLEAVRRPMIAKKDNARDMLGELRERMDVFAERVVGLLHDEVQQVEPEVERRLTQDEIEEMFTAVMREVRHGVYGREVVIVMSAGLGVGKYEREVWVRDVCKGMSRLVAQMWIRKLYDRHGGFVDMFERAEAEYRRLYDGLAKELDSRVAAVSRRNARIG